MTRTTAALVLALAALPGAAQNQLWIDQFGGKHNDEALASAPDGQGGVFVAGYVGREFGDINHHRHDSMLGRYDASGHRLWVHRFGAEAGAEVLAMASDGSGRVYLAGWTYGPPAGSRWLGRFDEQGNEIWTSTTPSGVWVEDAASDGSGGVLLCGLISHCSGPNSWFARYDPNGNLIWSSSYEFSSYCSWDSANSIVDDGLGGVFACGVAWSDPNTIQIDGWVARFDSVGNLTWSLNLASSGWDEMYAVLADGSGGVFLGGTLGGGGWLARLDSSGQQLWTLVAGAQSLAPDDAGGLFAAGYQKLQRIDGDGFPLWTQSFGNSSSINAVTRDGAGGAFVAGATLGSLGGSNKGGFDAWLARYDGSCNSGKTYCTASTTSIPGCQASIGGAGSPSIANPTGFTVSSGSVPGGGNVGICFFGDNGATNVPYGTLGGRICVKAPLFRTSPKPSGGSPGVCDGSFSFTLQDLINASPIIVSGAQIRAQVWARDPANPDGFLLSNGLSFTVCP